MAADYLAYLVVLSNLVYLFPLAVLLVTEHQRYALEGLVFLLVCLVSSVYHACAAPGLHWCPAPYAGLALVDEFLASIALTALVTPFLRHVGRLYRIAYLYAIVVLAFFLCVTLDQQGYVILTLLGLDAAAFGFVMWRTRGYTHGAYRWYLYGAASASGVVAIVCFCVGTRYAQDSDAYEQLHSCWHIFTAVAAGLFFLTLPMVDFYTLETQDTKPIGANSDADLHLDLAIDADADSNQSLEGVSNVRENKNGNGNANGTKSTMKSASVLASRTNAPSVTTAAASSPSSSSSSSASAATASRMRLALALAPTAAAAPAVASEAASRHLARKLTTSAFHSSV